MEMIVSPLFSLIAAIVAAWISGSIAYKVGTGIEKNKRTYDLVNFFDHELAMVRIILWKGKDEVLKAESIMEYYRAFSYEDIQNNELHLAACIQRLRYFFHRVAVSDPNWSICRKQIGENYADWYEYFILPGIAKMPMLDSSNMDGLPGRWLEWRKEAKLIAENVIEPERLQRILKKYPNEAENTQASSKLERHPI